MNAGQIWFKGKHLMIFELGNEKMKIGILSDTHNLLRPEVIEKLQDCDCILHGGDVSSQSVLDELEQIAPVKVVRGNNDKEWAEYLPGCLDFELAGVHFYMTHKKKDLPKDLVPYDVVIIGHSHQYVNTWIDHPGGHRTLIINPGSCGRRRFYQAITMAVLTINEDGWIVKRIEIPHREAGARTEGVDIRKSIEIVVGETQKGKSVENIARKYKLDISLVEQIVRLYVTHPGVTVDGIMMKMGL